MPTITAKDVMALRARTGVGMMECKAALAETDGDIDAAVDLLRTRLKGKMDERSGRPAAEGVVAAARSDDGSALALVELNTETDFVARNEQFLQLADRVAQLALEQPDGEVAADEQITKLVDELRITMKENLSFRRGHKLSGGALGVYVHHNRKIGVIVQADGEVDDPTLTGICQHIAAHVPTPLAVDAKAIPEQVMAKQQAAAVEEAQASGKPPEIAEKIASGKVRKFVEEHTLLGQTYVKDPEGKQTIKDVLGNATARTFVRYAVGAD